VFWVGFGDLRVYFSRSRFHHGRSCRCPGYSRNKLGLHFSIVEVADVQVLGETHRTQDDYNCLLGLVRWGLGYNIIFKLEVAPVVLFQYREARLP
jgi:hypothetical protein